MEGGKESPKREGQDGALRVQSFISYRERKEKLEKKKGKSRETGARTDRENWCIPGEKGGEGGRKGNQDRMLSTHSRGRKPGGVSRIHIARKRERSEEEESTSHVNPLVYGGEGGEETNLFYQSVQIKKKKGMNELSFLPFL